MQTGVPTFQEIPKRTFTYEERGRAREGERETQEWAFGLLCHAKQATALRRADAQ